MGLPPQPLSTFMIQCPVFNTVNTFLCNESTELNKSLYTHNLIQLLSLCVSFRYVEPLIFTFLNAIFLCVIRYIDLCNRNPTQEGPRKCNALITSRIILNQLLSFHSKFREGYFLSYHALSLSIEYAQILTLAFLFSVSCFWKENEN
jgi:hypothetical protein